MRVFSPLSILLALFASAAQSDNGPSAIFFDPTGKELLVAGGSSGRLCRMKLSAPNRGDVIDLGGNLVDLSGDHHGRLVVVDHERRQLIRLTRNADQIVVSGRVSLDVDPQRVAISHDSQFACVSGRWSQTVQIVRLPGNKAGVAEKAAPIHIGFETMELLPLSDGNFLAADAVGGQLAVITSTSNRVIFRHSLHGHNIRGLALSWDKSAVLVSHQILSRIARTDVDDIHWGSLIQNVVSSIPLDAILNSTVDFRDSIERIQLGDVGDGFADPTGIVSVDGGFAVLSGGTRQWIVWRGGQVVRRQTTGRRPTRLLAIPGNRLVILNEQDESLTIASLRGTSRHRTFRIDPATPLLISRGEVAFYDASLSHDGWLTCNSCHVDGHTPDLLADTFGDGGFGNPKRIPSLLGAGGTSPFGWLGNKPQLADQISASLASTMHADNPPAEVTEQLSRFVETLAFPANAVASSEEAVAGKQVFESLKCNDCHTAPRFTSSVVRDVGLKDELGHRKFNPPSLRGLRFRRAYFHDASAKSLRAVLANDRHQMTGEVSEVNRLRLIAYLQTL